MLKCSPIKFLTSLLLIVICSQASAAKLAIVIDDFGYRAKEDNQILRHASSYQHCHSS
ncbi:Uncharacterised protein [Providencia rustigianii]|nr:Uncharacterised protein [Providencia rustigianii]